MPNVTCYVGDCDVLQWLFTLPTSVSAPQESAIFAHSIEKFDIVVI